MNTQDQDSIETFRQRLEVRFRRDRIFQRCKILAGVVLASTLAVAVPFMLRAAIGQEAVPTIEGPGKWYLSVPSQNGTD